MSCSSDCTYNPSTSEDSDNLELSDPKMLSLPGEKTPEEARLEREGCFRALQVFRYNLFQKEPKVHEVDAFADLLYYEEQLRRDCQHEIVLRQRLKDNPEYWGPDVPSFEKDIRKIRKAIWMRIRYWWYTRGRIIGNSGPLQRAFESWRSTPLWYMHPILIEDCKSKGGCCGRDCGCCLDPQRENGLAGAFGAGHCTLKCGCCAKSRGFELTVRDEGFLVDCFSFDNQYATMNHHKDPYKRRIWLVAIFGLSVEDS